MVRMASETSNNFLQTINLIKFGNARPGNHFIYASFNAALQRLLYYLWRRSNRFRNIVSSWPQEAIIMVDIASRPFRRIVSKAIIESSHEARLAGPPCGLPGFLSKLIG